MLRKLPSSSATLVGLLLVAASFALSACSINVKKGDNGEDKKVDIQTPVGGIHVSNDADARDTGLPVYPGARLKEKQSSDDESSANVHMAWGPFELKVVALEYVSDDSPDKVAAFYRDKLKSYGTYLECHTDKADPGDVRMNHDKGSNQLSCGQNTGKNLELKVGTQDNQHLVNIRAQDSGKGTDFALVYVRTRGDDKDKDTI